MNGTRWYEDRSVPCASDPAYADTTLIPRGRHNKTQEPVIARMIVACYFCPQFAPCYRALKEYKNNNLEMRNYVQAGTYFDGGGTEVPL